MVLLKIVSAVFNPYRRRPLDPELDELPDEREPPPLLEPLLLEPLPEPEELLPELPLERETLLRPPESELPDELEPELDRPLEDPEPEWPDEEERRGTSRTADPEDDDEEPEERRAV